MRVSVLCLTAAVFAGMCTSVQAKKENYKIKVVRSKPGQKEDKYFLYLKGTLQHMTGELKQALDTFQGLVKNDPPMATYDGFIRFLFEAEQFGTLSGLKDEVWDHFKHDVDIQLIRAKTMLQVNNHAQAEKLFTQLFADHPNNEQVLYYGIVFHMRRQELSKALELADTALSNKQLRQKHFLFYFLKSKVLFAQGNHQDALALAKKSVELFPRFAKGMLFQALLQEQMGKIDAAIAGYERFLDMSGGDESVEKQLISLLFSHGRFTQAASRLKKMKREKPEYYFDLALIEWKAGKQKDALTSIDKALKLNYDFIKAKLLKVEILLAVKKISKLMKFMSEWLMRSPEDTKGFQTIMLLAKTSVDKNEIIKVLKSVARKASKKTLAMLALSDMYMEANKYDEALGFYTKLADQVQQPILLGKVLYQMGYIYFATNKHEQLEKTLNRALKIKPVSASVYNLFAFHLAQTGKNIEKAHEYVDQALKLNPNSHYHLDTKGYAFLKEGKLQQAKVFFHKALVLAPHDTTIRQHYAQTVQQMAVGK